MDLDNWEASDIFQSFSILEGGHVQFNNCL